MARWSLFAAAAGLLWGLCFASRPHSLLACVGLAPLLLLLSHRRAGLLGFIHGLAMWMSSLFWIVPTLVTYGKLPFAAAVPLTALLAAYLALFHAAFARLGAPIWRRFRLLPCLLALPSLWVALEWLRTYLGGGFPWNLAAYSWVEVPGALPLASWIGAYGISWLVLLSATGVAASLELLLGRGAGRQRLFSAPSGPSARSARSDGRAVLAAFALPLLLLPLAGRSSLRQSEREAAHLRQPRLPVRLLQPNIPDLVAPDAPTVMRNYAKMLDLAFASCQPGTLVVFPESGAWPFTLGRDALLDRDLARLTDRGCTVLVNSEAPAGDAYYNSVFELAPGGGVVARYDKRHLVPFGEYIPFRWAFFFMDTLGRGIGSYRPGGRPVLLPWRGERLGTAVCYEVVFPEEVAELTRAGATLLLSVTNDAWYGDTAAPWQHFRAVRFRAAENRRTFLRAAITGVSALVEPDGSVAAQIGVFRSGVIRANVAGQGVLTPYARWPWLPPLAASGAALGAIYSARRRSREHQP